MTFFEIWKTIEKIKNWYWILVLKFFFRIFASRFIFSHQPIFFIYFLWCQIFFSNFFLSGLFFLINHSFGYWIASRCSPRQNFIGDRWWSSEKWDGTFAKWVSDDFGRQFDFHWKWDALKFSIIFNLKDWNFQEFQTFKNFQFEGLKCSKIHLFNYLISYLLFGWNHFIWAFTYCMDFFSVVA